MSHPNVVVCSLRRDTKTIICNGAQFNVMRHVNETKNTVLISPRLAFTNPPTVGVIYLSK